MKKRSFQSETTLEINLLVEIQANTNSIASKKENPT